MRLAGKLAGVLVAGLCLGGCAASAPRTSTPVAPVAAAAAPTIVPLPQRVALEPGTLTLRGAVQLQADPQAWRARRALDALLAESGLEVHAHAPVHITTALTPDAALGAEGYTLSIDDGITIRAHTDVGLFYGVETLRQLLPAKRATSITLPHLHITDVPAYAWRGSGLDVARSYYPVSYLRRHIDLMALFKLNHLHLHLTDDQGWRMEIKAYPRLAEIGGASAVKGGRSGFYTQAELKDLVAYADARGITIVPEIDMPSHVQAAIASYPELACDGVTNLSTYSGVKVGWNILCLQKPDVVYPFVRNVLKEVIAVFPSPDIHIGGDEIDNPLYTDFIARTTQIVHELGRHAVMWEEGSRADTRPDVLVQLWNDNYPIAGAVAKGHHLVLSPCSYMYLDQGNYAGQPGTYDWCRKQGLPLARVYQFAPQDFPSAAGPEGVLWSEWVHDDATADNRLWPRLAAVAEAAWRTPGARDYADFTRRLNALRPFFDAYGVKYYPEPDLGWNRP